MYIDVVPVLSVPACLRRVQETNVRLFRNYQLFTFLQDFLFPMPSTFPT